MSQEKVDILNPTTLQKTGEVKTLADAWKAGDWVGTFNVWIIQTSPEPAIVYQLRSPNSSWEPNKLDVSAGGHLQAGEEPQDGVREAEEELGRTYNKKNLVSLGFRKNESHGTDGTKRNTVCNIFLVEDNAPLNEYRLDVQEVPAIFLCPLSKLLEVFEDASKTFTAQGISHDGTPLRYEVSQKSFPYNADNYHQRMAKLIDAYIKGDKGVQY